MGLTMEILKVKSLRIFFDTPSGTVKAVDGVSFSLRSGETLGIVGESGAGKSVTALSVMGMAPRLGARFISGEVWYRGRNLFENPGLYRDVRGKKISLIPQEAGAALNPVITVGRQMEELMQVHLGLSARERRVRTAELLESVEIPDPGTTAGMYPHQLSGGTIQRILLAMALSCRPDILIADEPASSLDTTLQGEILRLVGRVKEREGLAVVLISHDLGIIAQNSDRVMVMFGGRLMEYGEVREVLRQPLHPYTTDLLEIYHCLERGLAGNARCRDHSARAAGEAGGCGYAARCDRAGEICRLKRPTPIDFGGRAAACHKLLG